MTDANDAIHAAAVHEVGHSFMQYLLSGAFGGLEVKWTSPGDGQCWTKWPTRWRDEPVKFWLFTGLVDAAGIESEYLVLKSADRRHSAGDLADLVTAADELRALPHTEFHGSSRAELITLFREMATHVLRPHERALGYLGGRMSSKSNWLGSDMEQALVTTFPAYHSHEPLFDADWRARWCTLLDDLNDHLEDTVGWVSPRSLANLEKKVYHLGADLRLQRAREGVR
jgi:hypothetical protein